MCSFQQPLSKNIDKSTAINREGTLKSQSSLISKVIYCTSAPKLTAGYRQYSFKSCDIQSVQVMKQVFVHLSQRLKDFNKGAFM